MSTGVSPEPAGSRSPCGSLASGMSWSPLPSPQSLSGSSSTGSLVVSGLNRRETPLQGSVSIPKRGWMEGPEPKPLSPSDGESELELESLAGPAWVQTGVSTPLPRVVTLSSGFSDFLARQCFFFFFFFFFPSSGELAPVESTGTLWASLGCSSGSRIQGSSLTRQGQSCMDGNPRVKSGGTNGDLGSFS